MDRLTIDCRDVGLGICFSNPNDPEGAYDITDLNNSDPVEQFMLMGIAERLAAYEDSGLMPDEVNDLAANRKLWLDNTFHGVADVIAAEVFVKTPFEQLVTSVVSNSIKAMMDRQGFDLSKDYNIEVSADIRPATPVSTICFNVVIEEGAERK